jgi:hypothetical protein
MSERPSRLKLPSFFPRAIGQVGDGQLDHKLFPEEASQLISLASRLLEQTKTLADANTPLTRQHNMVMFRVALDALVRYLTVNYGSYSPGSEGKVQPPCNFPMFLQTAIRQIAEIVQLMQDWDAQQPMDRVPDILPADLVSTLQRTIFNVQPRIRGKGEKPRGNQSTPTVWYHGGRSYSLDGQTPILSSREQHNALQAFLDRSEALDTRALQNNSVSNAADVMGKIDKKWPGTVQPPKSKGDGYYIRVRTLSN